MEHTIKVLIADDHEIVRRFLAEFLESRDDIEVVALASDGNEAIEQAERCQPDVVLLDLNMPGRNGYEALRAIKHRQPQTKVFIVSANEGTMYRAMAKVNNADGYLEKSDLKKQIARLLEELVCNQIATQHAA